MKRENFNQNIAVRVHELQIQLFNILVHLKNHTPLWKTYGKSFRGCMGFKWEQHNIKPIEGLNHAVSEL